MTRNRTWLLLALGLALAAAPALAQQGTPDQTGGANAATQTQTQTQPQTGTTPTPGTPAVIQEGTTANEHASTEAQAHLQEVMDRARKTPAKTAEAADKQLMTHAKSVDAEATSKGDQTVVGRLATEFGMTPDALTSERAQFNTGWGDLMIAHMLAANSKTTVTVQDLFQMRTDGMGWGQIANGLGFRLGEVVSATKAETRVATGLSKPDGKPARIGAVNASASTKGNAGVAGGHVKTGAAADVGVGAGNVIPKGHSGK